MRQVVIPTVDHFNESLIRRVKSICHGLHSTVEKARQDHAVRDYARKKFAAHDQVLAERWLEQLDSYHSPQLLAVYGAKISHSLQVTIYMEFMDCLSFDAILNAVNRVPADVMSKLVVPVGIFY
jgi:hypothetical protein